MGKARSLGTAVCQANRWHLDQARFYTGIPDAGDDPFWNYFWAGKLRTLSRQGVEVFSRSLRYRNKIVKLPDGSTHAFLTAEEKGIDVRIAIDVIRLAHRNVYDAALVFSQDQDLSECCAEIRVIAKEQNRWIKIASAFPVSPTTTNKRGIPNSDWTRIDRAMYDACLDPRDYRPKKL
jgi:uncharacterized LabA/DUF88 family protein